MMRMGLPKTILLCLAFLADTASKAQIGESRNDFALGVNVGMSMNKMDFSPTIKQNYLNAPTLGITARYVCEKYFSSICAVQVELNYAKLGWKENILDVSHNTYERHLSYLQLPMLMQLGWGREKRGLKFIFSAGPVVQYLFADKEKRGGGEWNTDHRPNNIIFQYDHKPDYHFDYGIMGGIGLELSTGIGHFLLEGRYYYGLGDIYDNSKKGYFQRSAHQTILAKLTYLYDLKTTKR